MLSPPKYEAGVLSGIILEPSQGLSAGVQQCRALQLPIKYAAVLDRLCAHLSTLLAGGWTPLLPLTCRPSAA